MDKEKVEKQAKEILDKFSKALEKAEKKEGMFFVEREEFERKEGEGEHCKGFKNKLLENAPEKDENFIIGERGGWK